jgi:hypothetical protein
VAEETQVQNVAGTPTGVDSGSSVSPGAASTAGSSPVQAGSVGSAGGQGVSGPSSAATGGGASQDAGYQSVRDALATYGYDIRNQYQDDHQALQHLVSLARQAQEQSQLLPYAQQYLQHAPQFQQWLQAQRQQKLAQEQQQQNWWKAPEYDPSWQNKIVRDPQTGELKTLPGSSPDLIQKYLAWADHQRSFLDKFSQDPISAIRPGIEQLVQEQAAKIVQQQLHHYQEQTLARQVLNQHAEWMYERGQDGNVRLSPMGRRYGEYVNQIERAGIMDTQTQNEMAFGLVQRDFLLAKMQAAGQGVQQQTAQAPAPVDPKQAFLAQAAAGASNQPSAPPGNVNGSYKAPNGPSRIGLAEELTKALAAAGIGPGSVI